MIPATAETTVDSRPNKNANGFKPGEGVGAGATGALTGTLATATAALAGDLDAATGLADALATGAFTPVVAAVFFTGALFLTGTGFLGAAFAGDVATALPDTLVADFAVTATLGARALSAPVADFFFLAVGVALLGGG